MITCHNETTPYCTQVTNGEQSTLADTGTDYGGQGNGFRPHDFLEAALASCINITIRMYAEKHNIPIKDVITHVRLNREQEGKTIFEYDIELTGDITEEQRNGILSIAKRCPVGKTLSKEISFQLL